MDSEDRQPFKIAIRPGITDVLGGSALRQLAVHALELDGENDIEVA
jgi:hypothetical protein